MWERETKKEERRGKHWEKTSQKHLIMSWKVSERVFRIYGCLQVLTVRDRNRRNSDMPSLSTLSQNMCTCTRQEHSSTSAAKCCLSPFWHLLTNSCGLTYRHCFVPFHLCYLCIKLVLLTMFPSQGGNRKLLATYGISRDLSSTRKISNTTPTLLCLWQATHYSERANISE